MAVYSSMVDVEVVRIKVVQRVPRVMDEAPAAGQGLEEASPRMAEISVYRVPIKFAYFACANLLSSSEPV
jgi:hypothetical protein